MPVSAVVPEITTDPSSIYGKEGSATATIETPAPGKSFRSFSNSILCYYYSRHNS